MAKRKVTTQATGNYKYRMMKVNCSACGTEYDGVIKNCPQCGAATPASKEGESQFESQPGADYITDEKIIAEVQKGANLRCPNCDTRNEADRETCTNCGAPLDQAKNLLQERDEAKERYGPQTHEPIIDFLPSTPTGRPSNVLGMIIGGAVGLVILCGLGWLIYQVAFNVKEEEAKLTGIEAVCSMSLEKNTLHTGANWDELVPDNVTITSRTEKVRKTETKVITEDKEFVQEYTIEQETDEEADCPGAEPIDTGTGAEAIPQCKVVIEIEATRIVVTPVPVATQIIEHKDTWIEYQWYQWDIVDTQSRSSFDHTVTCPTFSTRSDLRTTKPNYAYYVTVDGYDGRHDVSQTEWQNANSGETVTIKVNGLGGLNDVIIR